MSGFTITTYRPNYKDKDKNYDNLIIKNLIFLNILKKNGHNLFTENCQIKYVILKFLKFFNSKKKKTTPAK